MMMYDDDDGVGLIIVLNYMYMFFTKLICFNKLNNIYCDSL